MERPPADQPRKRGGGVLGIQASFMESSQLHVTSENMTKFDRGGKLLAESNALATNDFLCKRFFGSETDSIMFSCMLPTLDQRKPS
jgi:hypothetical protein